MNEEFIEALHEIVKEKGISEDLLFSTIEDALVAAYKRIMPMQQHPRMLKLLWIGLMERYMFMLRKRLLKMRVKIQKKYLLKMQKN